MNFTQEFEFTCTETTDDSETQTVKRFISNGESYTEIVDVFLAFLSAAYGYPITLDRLRNDEYEETLYRGTDLSELSF